MQRLDRRRKITNVVMLSLTGLATLLAIIPLFWVTIYVIIKGGAYINLDLFIHLPQAMGAPGGGVLHAIEGSAIMVSFASLFSIPPALLAAFYLLQHPNTPLATALRFSTDLLAGMPSIVIGLFGYAIIVVTQKHYSALAGSAVLAIIMLPVILRSAEEMLKLVPSELREGALALGTPEWKAAITVVLPAAAEGIVTGIMLAIARAAGETAPLIFTALGNDHYEIFNYIRQGITYKQGIGQTLTLILEHPTDALPLTLWKYAQQPYPERVQQAWAVALVLMLFVLLLNIAARLWLARRRRQRYG
ncbi:MAG: phosphate ABC transporter permease PstA [Anaerolineae bacterium]|nr:MAG: phosphate ABC transporter permease PstA [Anaerolineae bacterium]